MKAPKGKCKCVPAVERAIHAVRLDGNLMMTGSTSHRAADASYEPSAQRARQGGRKLWLACELQKLEREVERHRLKDGSKRIRWAPLAEAWERSRHPDDAKRTVAALKAAYAKLSRNILPGTEARVPFVVGEQGVEDPTGGGNPTQVDSSFPDVGGGDPASAISEARVIASRTLESKELLLQKFEKFYSIAIADHDRVPVRRPKGEIPKELLEIGNGILATKVPETFSNGKQYLARLNAAVYAIARAIAATADEMTRDGDAVDRNRTLMEAIESRRILIANISTLTNELHRRKAWKRKERTWPPSRKTDSPPIVGLGKPFQISPELNDWAKDQGISETPKRSEELNEEEWRSLYSKVKPWKATGPDGIQGFWWKHLEVARTRLTYWCRKALVKPRKVVPSWMCEARVVLIPKELKRDQSSRGPGDFRPIACLNVCYKILSASMSFRILRTVGDRFPSEQIALRKGVWSCTHAHILDQTIIKDALRHKKELHMLWVDLTKAFDSLSHGAIKWTIKQWGVPSDLRRTLSVLMSMQSVRYYGFTNGKLVRSRRLRIRNGLMQGDSLSPLLFCLAIGPVSSWIRKEIEPYQTRTGIGHRSDGVLEAGHILYMDDLKVYSPSWEDMVKARYGIQRMFGSLGLELNARKCATRSLNCAIAGTAQLDTIPILGASEFYKYLGAEQNSLICLGELWNRVENAAKVVAKRLFDSDLTVRQMINGYNQVVIPKLKYAISCVIFGAGKLSTLKKCARQFDCDIRKAMADSHLRFKSSCTGRLYTDKELGGLGVKSVEEELDRSIAYSWCYLASNTDLLVSYELAESLRSSHKRSLTSDFRKLIHEYLSISFI
ncbi:hypothetical protein RB195_010621 [Necator americanus]|uniref:Reverse transcriptase domain-containing protein n=1 Tax=Necator americanus TaxID=51031 RepID=A0ABR1CYV6_NECAM